MFWIEINDFEAICFSFCRQIFTFKEPIPDFATRIPGILESCLVTPRQQAFRKDLYHSFEDKLAILFYLMIKNHPFVNGNKRMAVATLLVTLYGNGKWIKANADEIYKLAVEVSSSKTNEKDKYVLKIKTFLKERIVERSVIEKLLERFK